MIISGSKNLQSDEKLREMTARAFPNLNVVKITPLEEGYFNAAYRIKLSNEMEAVLKIAPSPKTIVMTYEIGIMNSEVNAMKMAGEKTTLPVPKVFYYDNSHELCDSDYFFMELLDGNSWDKLMQTASEELKEAVDYKTGMLNAELNQLASDKFGYYGQLEKQNENWYITFQSMLNNIFNDSEVLDINMGCSRSEVLALLQMQKGYFDEVKKPQFVHWDIWAGNVFVQDRNITGIIDFERCLWADPLMEVGFRSKYQKKAFLKGYGRETFSQSERIRILWYDLYLFLTNALECDYRKYSDDAMYHWAKKEISATMDQLSKV